METQMHTYGISTKNFKNWKIYLDQKINQMHVLVIQFLEVEKYFLKNVVCLMLNISVKNWF